MCVVAIALNAHPRWQLVLAGNRDEFHARPSAPLARWEGADSHILAGRDLQSGGTWLGVSEEGRMAVVTNIRTGFLPDPDKASRGALITDFLSGQTAFDNLESYNPFSLFAITGQEGWFAANHPQPVVTQLGAGIHSLSNGVADDIWPRREMVHQALADWLIAEHATPELLLDMLMDETPLSADDSHAPIFIRDKRYGTRCSSVVLLDHDGEGVIIERRFGPNGLDLGETQIDFRWPA